MIVKGKNVGRLFEGQNIDYTTAIVYKQENGKAVVFQTLTAYECVEPNKILVKKGNTFEEATRYSAILIFLDEYEPGVYSVAVWTYGCKRVYENIITIGSGEEVQKELNQLV